MYLSARASFKPEWSSSLDDVCIGLLFVTYQVNIIF